MDTEPHTDAAETAGETAETAAAEAAETVAPGSTTTDDADAMTVDRVRSIAREVVDAAISDLKSTLEAATPVAEPEPESFSTPKRAPWTHRGSR